MSATETFNIRPAAPLLSRFFYALIALALLSIVLSIAGKMIGRALSLGGHTDSVESYEIVIGNNVMALPANAIRFRNQRHNGVAKRVELYLRWPDMRGYSGSTKNDFNGLNAGRRLLFVAIEEQSMSRDMSGRYLPIYSTMVEEPGKPGPDGLTIHRFKPGTAYAGEDLIVANRGANAMPFVARCLDEDVSKAISTACQRDVHFGDGLQLIYRFPRELIGEWQAIDTAIGTFASNHLKSDPRH
ncbi:MAG: hypothetical protein ACRECW_16630 [Phyllobacterium sp.]